MVMGFAPTWLRQVSPLVHMTTLTTVGAHPASDLLNAATKLATERCGVVRMTVIVDLCVISIYWYTDRPRRSMTVTTLVVYNINRIGPSTDP